MIAREYGSFIRTVLTVKLSIRKGIDMRFDILQVKNNSVDFLFSVNSEPKAKQAIFALQSEDWSGKFFANTHTGLLLDVCRHLNMLECGMLNCEYGCKIVKCEKCNKQFASHRRIYGCPKG